MVLRLDKYSAVWPFFGLVLQVAFFSIAIIIYERHSKVGRRSTRQIITVEALKLLSFLKPIHFLLKIKIFVKRNFGFVQTCQETKKLQPTKHISPNCQMWKKSSLKPEKNDLIMTSSRKFYIQMHVAAYCADLLVLQNNSITAYLYFC